MPLLSPPDELPASACQFGIALLTEYAGSSLAFETVCWGKQSSLHVIATLLTASPPKVYSLASSYVQLFCGCKQVLHYSLESVSLTSSPSSWDCPHNKRRLAMIALCVIMYEMATAHWYLTFHQLQVLATHFGEDSAHLMDVWNLNPSVKSVVTGQGRKLTCALPSRLYAVWDLQSIISGANTAPTVLLTITVRSTLLLPSVNMVLISTGRDRML